MLKNLKINRFDGDKQMDKTKEEWIEIEHKFDLPNSIVGISTRGRIKRLNGTISWSTIRQEVRVDGRPTLIYHLLADRFIPKTKEDIDLCRNCIDHITHNPQEMNVNDIRNLRWCTFKENLNFDEARANNSASKKGLHLREKSCRWGEITSEFSKKFAEHYGIHPHDDRKLYHRSKVYFTRTGNLRWEVLDD